MCAEASSNRTSSSGAGVVPSRVLFGAPTAGREVGALKSVVAKLVTVEALS
jgi:hypothetical protein